MGHSAPVAVVFLKGVNVGGHRRLKPSLLARRLRRYEAVNVGSAGTFIVSGRVSRRGLAATIREAVSFEVQMVICSAREIRAIADETAFDGAPGGKANVRFVSMQVRRAPLRRRPPFALGDGRRWDLKVLVQRGRFILGVHRRQMRALGALAQLEELGGGAITTRSWGTIRRLAAMMADERPE